MNKDAVLQRAREYVCRSIHCKKCGHERCAIIRDLVLLVEQSQVYREALVGVIEDIKYMEPDQGLIACAEGALRDADVKAGRKP